MEYSKTTYSRLFGGIFSTLEEYPGVVEASEMYSRAIKMLDRYMEFSLYGSHLERDVVNWINSPVLDTLFKYSEKDPFFAICLSGSVELASLFLEKHPNSRCDHWSFRDVCQGGNLDMIKWLVSKFPKQDYDGIFVLVCREGHLDVAKWMVEKFPNVHVHATGETPFSIACFHGHIDLAEWFLAKYPETKVHIMDDIIFRSVCGEGHLQMAKWFMTKFPETQCDIEEVLINAIRKKDKEMARWLFDRFMSS